MPKAQVYPLAFLFLAIALNFTACTDYVAEIDDRYGEWETASVTPQSSDSETSVSIAESLRAPAMRYIAADRRLEIGVAGSFRVDVVRMDGTRVLASSARVVDLSGLRAGVYVVRLVSAGSALQLKILKSVP